MEATLRTPYFSSIITSTPQHSHRLNISSHGVRLFASKLSIVKSPVSYSTYNGVSFIFLLSPRKLVTYLILIRLCELVIFPLFGIYFVP